MTIAVGPLRRGDRLEVGYDVSDHHDDLGRLAKYPARLSFWRRSPENLLNGPCVLLTSGALRLENVVGGFLHTFDEGVSQYIGGELALLLFENDRSLHRRVLTSRKHQCANIPLGLIEPEGCFLFHTSLDVTRKAPWM